MVQVDAGDHGHRRVDDIHRVQAPAQAHFQHHHLHPPRAKHQQGREGGKLKIGKTGGTAGTVYPLKGGNDLLVTDLYPSHPYTLVEAQYMRGGVHPREPPRTTEQGLQHRDRRTLAVGARHADNRHRHWQQVQRRGHRGHTRQAELNGPGMKPFQPLQPLRE